MPKLLAIICGIILGCLVLLKGINLVTTSILLLPIYFSVRNLVRQSHVNGNWTIRWSKFFEAFIVELVAIGIPVYMMSISEPSSISLIVGLTGYIIVTAVAYGATKKDDSCKEQQRCI